MYCLIIESLNLSNIDGRDYFRNCHDIETKKNINTILRDNRMNLVKRSIYIYKYVVTFINDNYKIYNFVDQTGCSDSILDIIVDNCLQRDSNIYMFNIFKDKVLIKNCSREENKEEIRKKRWIESIIKDIAENKYLNAFKDECEMNHKTQKELFHLFFVQQINIPMSQSLFEKVCLNQILKNEKITYDELFFLIYTHSFSFLDNRSCILEKIFLFISENAFDFSKINKYFVKFVHQNYDILITDENIDDFFENGFSIEITKEIIYKNSKNKQIELEKLLNNWKQAINNCFLLMKTSLSIKIIVPDEGSTLRIRNTDNIICETQILYENIENILFFINNESFFCIEDLNDGLLNCIMFIINKNDIKTIRIDITGYFMSLYGLYQKCIDFQIKKFQNFYTSVIQKKNFDQNIFFIVGCFQKQIDTCFEIIRFFELKERDFCCLMIISKYILNIQKDHEESLLMEFAEKINFSFNENCKYFGIDNYDIHKSYDSDIDCLKLPRKRGEICKKMEFMHYIGDELHAQNFFLGCYNHSLHVENAQQVTGFYDGNFSILELISSNAKIEDQIMKNILTDVHYNRQEDKEVKNYFIFEKTGKFCNLSLNECSKTIHTIDNIEELYVVEEEQNENCKKNSMDFFVCCSKNLNSSILLYHSILKNRNRTNVLNIYPSFFNTTIQPVFLPNMKIQNSNFDIIFLRFLKITSINKLNSIVQINLRNPYYSLIIKNCEIIFLKKVPEWIRFLTIENSIFLDTYKFSCDDYNDQELEMEIKSSSFIMQIDKKIEASSLNSEFAGFEFDIYNKMVDLDFSHCRVNVLSPIHSRINSVNFIKCKIECENDTLIFDHSDSNKDMNDVSDNGSEEKIQSTSSAVFIVESEIGKEFLIKGDFDEIEISDCESTIKISHICNKMEIMSHEGSIYIGDHIFDAQFSKNENSFLRVVEGFFLFENLHIAHLQNLKMNHLRIISCSILKIENIFTKKIHIESIKSILKIIDSASSVTIEPQIRNYFEGKNENFSLTTNYENTFTSDDTDQ